MCLLSINFEYDIWNICEHVDYILKVGMCFSEIPETDSFSILNSTWYEEKQKTSVT